MKSQYISHLIPPPNSAIRPKHHATPFSRLSFLDTIEVIAESGQKRCVVHCSVLSAQSRPVLRTQSEATDKKINLSDWDGDTVERFLQFLYIGDYQLPESTLPDGDMDEDEESDEEVGQTIRRDGVDTPDTPDTVQSLRDTNVLLVHAKVYALAQSREIETLRTMAFERLKVELQGIDRQMAPRVKSSVIGLCGYVYRRKDPYTGSHTGGSEEPMRDLVSTFAAKNFRQLMDRREMRQILNEGGDFVVELMEKVAERYCDVEKKHSNMEREIQDWKARATASDEKIGQLEATKVQELEAIRANLKKLEVYLLIFGFNVNVLSWADL